MAHTNRAALLALVISAGCTDAGTQNASVQADTGLCGSANVPAINFDAELLIRDLSVVEDRRRTHWDNIVDPVDDQEGAWSFGRLFADLARKPDDNHFAHDHCLTSAGCKESYHPTPPSQYVINWLLSNWDNSENVLINCDSVPMRPNVVSDIIEHWPKLTSDDLNGDKVGDLDLTQAPFRLLAIVRRPDLADLSPPGTNINDCNTFVRDPRGAGELRFVFGLVDSDTDAPKDFTVILEYNVPANTNAAIDAEMQRWHTLAASAFGSDAYLSRLATLTREITRDGSRESWPHDPGQAPCDADAGVDDGSDVHAGRQHDNNLRRIRTQDRVLDPKAGSQFRQFEVPEDSGANAVGRFYLTDTPAYKYRQSDRLGDFITQNCADIQAEHFKVGQEFPQWDGKGEATCMNPDYNNAQFQAGQMPNEQTASEVWDPKHDNTTVSCNGTDVAMGELRHLFARNTCNGCHGTELEMNAHDGLAAQPFHIAPRLVGQVAPISRLLQGEYDFVDPLGNARTLDEPKKRIDAYTAGICAQNE